MKAIITTYVITEQGYGKVKEACQYFGSFVATPEAPYSKIPVEPGIETIKLVDQRTINVAKWIAKLIGGQEFNPGFVSLWDDGKHDYFAGKYFNKYIEDYINNNGVLPNTIFSPIGSYTQINLNSYTNSSLSYEEQHRRSLTRDKEIEEFGRELIKLWKELPKINKEKVVIIKPKDKVADHVDDDTHKGSFFGIGNRD